jgi:sugar lactone lactonase YvrE
MRRRWIPLLVLFSFLSPVTCPAAEPPLPGTVAEGATLVEVFADDCFFEGPTWDQAGGKLYFTAFYPDKTRILRLDSPGTAAVWMDQTQGVNGTWLSLDGRLLGAQAFGHRLVSYGFGADGPTDPETLLYAPGLNQPNDVCQTPNGDIYFTDPDFDGQKKSAVFRYRASGEVTKVIDDMPVPNGVIASLDGRTLYVGDSHLVLWRAYPIFDEARSGRARCSSIPRRTTGPLPTACRSTSRAICISAAAAACGWPAPRGSRWVSFPCLNSAAMSPLAARMAACCT